MARALVFLTDAFGGRGGIAQFNRDLLTSLSERLRVHQGRRAAARASSTSRRRFRSGWTFAQQSAGGKVRYVIESLKAVVRERFDVVICSHINLLPIAAAAAAAQRVPLLLVVYGIEAWKAPRGARGEAGEDGERRRRDQRVHEAALSRVVGCGVVSRARDSVLRGHAKRFGVGPKRDGSAAAVPAARTHRDAHRRATRGSGAREGDR